MFLSIYTSVRNGIFFDYHVTEMLKHHLPLADEIIVNDGMSSDGTYERITALDPKIKVFRGDWGEPNSFNWITNFKNEARKKASGEWCMNLDCDEFIPEWDFERLRAYLQQTRAAIIPLRIINFYGNYKVYHRCPERVPWPDKKWNIHQNLPDMEVWGDGSNVRQKGSTAALADPEVEFVCHHFGFVRHPARLRQKWRNVLGNLYNEKYKTGRRKWFKIPWFVFNWLPHNWKDPQFMPDLALYEGPFIQAVRDNPDEFVRDRFSLYRYLLNEVGRESSGAGAARVDR